MARNKGIFSSFRRQQAQADNLYRQTSRNKQTENFRPFYSDNVNYMQQFNISKGQTDGLSLATNNALGSGIINTIVKEAIGSGLNCEAIPDEKFFNGKISHEDMVSKGRTIESYFDIWQNNPKFCDAYGNADLGELETQTAQMVLSQGEAFGLIRIANCGGIYLPQVELISPLMVSSPNDTDTNNIIAGIEFDARHREIAYFVKVIDVNSPTSTKWSRIPKYTKSGRMQMFHIMSNIKQPNQVRGTSILTPVKDALVQIDRYIDANLVKSILQSNIAWFVEKPSEVVEDSQQTTLEEITSAAEYFNDATNLSRQSDPDCVKEEKPVEIKPGMLLDLRPGEKISMPESKAPTSSFWEFINGMSKIIASSTGQPPEKLFKSYLASYSASQASMQESHSNAEYWRKVITKGFCDIVYKQFVRCIVAQNLVDLPMYFDNEFAMEAWSKAQWYGSALIHNDPVKAVNAAILRINNGLSTREIEARNLTGKSWEAIATKLAEEQKVIDRLGLALGDANTETDSNAEDGEEEETEDSNTEQPKAEPVEEEK